MLLLIYFCAGLFGSQVCYVLAQYMLRQRLRLEATCAMEVVLVFSGRFTLLFFSRLGAVPYKFFLPSFVICGICTVALRLTFGDCFYNAFRRPSYVGVSTVVLRPKRGRRLPLVAIPVLLIIIFTTRDLHMEKHTL